MFRFSKPETPRAALFVFLRNETRAKSGFVSYVSISLCFDFDPLVSVADRVAARVIARERRGRILSNFHIVESMPKSISILIHYIHLVDGLVLCLV
jgi:hypothetical protein